MNVSRWCLLVVPLALLPSSALSVTSPLARPTSPTSPIGLTSPIGQAATSERWKRELVTKVTAEELARFLEREPAALGLFLLEWALFEEDVEAAERLIEEVRFAPPQMRAAVARLGLKSGRPRLAEDQFLRIFLEDHAPGPSFDYLLEHAAERTLAAMDPIEADDDVSARELECRARLAERTGDLENALRWAREAFYATSPRRPLVELLARLDPDALGDLPQTYGCVPVPRSRILARAAWTRGQTKEALLALGSLRDHGVQDEERLREIGNTLLELGDEAAAKEAFVQAAAIDPWIIDRTMTRTAPAEMLVHAERLTREDPLSAWEWTHRGDIAWWAGRNDEALAAWERALALEPRDLYAFTRLEKARANQDPHRVEIALERFALALEEASDGSR